MYQQTKHLLFEWGTHLRCRAWYKATFGSRWRVSSPRCIDRWMSVDRSRGAFRSGGCAQQFRRDRLPVVHSWAWRFTRGRRLVFNIVSHLVHRANGAGKMYLSLPMYSFILFGHCVFRVPWKLVQLPGSSSPSQHLLCTGSQTATPLKALASLLASDRPRRLRLHNFQLCRKIRYWTANVAFLKCVRVAFPISAQGAGLQRCTNRAPVVTSAEEGLLFLLVWAWQPRTISLRSLQHPVRRSCSNCPCFGLS